MLCHNISIFVAFLVQTLLFLLTMMAKFKFRFIMACVDGNGRTMGVNDDLLSFSAHLSVAQFC